MCRPCLHLQSTSLHSLLCFIHLLPQIDCSFSSILAISWSEPGGIKKIFHTPRLLFWLKKEEWGLGELFIVLVWFSLVACWGFQVEDFSILQFGTYWRQNQTNQPRELIIVSFVKSWVSRQCTFSFYFAEFLCVCCVI